MVWGMIKHESYKEVDLYAKDAKMQTLESAEIERTQLLRVNGGGRHPLMTFAGALAGHGALEISYVFVEVVKKIRFLNLTSLLPIVGTGEVCVS
jgi:hypothetical protein